MFLSRSFVLYHLNKYYVNTYGVSHVSYDFTKISSFQHYVAINIFSVTWIIGTLYNSLICSNYKICLTMKDSLRFNEILLR